MNVTIPISEKLYLLGIHPEKGGIIGASANAMDYVLVGSLFMELYQAKNIRFENKRIIVENTKSDVVLHRFLLDKLGKSKRPLKISTWINKFYYSLKHIRKEVQNGLVEKRIVRMEHKHFFFFKWQKPYIANKQVVIHLLVEIENQLFGNRITEEGMIFLSFLKPAGLLQRIFADKQKRNKAKERLKKIMVENQVSEAVAAAISAAQAVAASVIATSAVVGATS